MPGEAATAPSLRGCVTASSISAAPTTPRIISAVMRPGRSTRGTSPVTSTTVDSTPTSHGPPSTMAAMRPSKSWATCAAVVGLGLPDRLADGAASGQPLSLMMRRATGCTGNRTARVGSPPDTFAATASDRGKMRVSGPGQNASASFSAIGDTRVTRGYNCSRSPICTISGLSCGRPLAAKIAATASAFRASAARPYTVSVGMATGNPCRSNSAAVRISVGESVRCKVFMAACLLRAGFFRSARR